MLQNGIIKPSASPWASLVVLTKKADQTLQLCIDYRNLNKATIKDSYPLLHIQDTLSTLYGNTLFTTLALLKVYHQIKVEESSRENAAIAANVGLFQYIRLRFRLTDASATQEKSGVIIPITISSQHCHISCSALIDTGSPVTYSVSYPTPYHSSHIIISLGQPVTA